MPMDPTLGIRLYQALLAKGEAQRAAQNDQIARQKAQMELEQGRQFERDFAPIRQRLAGGMAPQTTAPTMQLELQSPELAAAAPGATAPAGPLFKTPKGWLPGAPFDVVASPARRKAAEIAKSKSEAELIGQAAGVMDVFERNLGGLDTQDVLTPEEQILMAASPRGGRIVEAIANMRGERGQNRRYAMGQAVEEVKLGETARSNRASERQRDREIVISGKNADTSAGRLAQDKKKYERDVLIEGATPEEYAANKQKYKDAEETGRIAAQTRTGTNKLQLAHAREAAAMARALISSGTSRANAITQAQAKLTAQASAAGYDVTGALGAFNMEMEQPDGFFATPTVKATAPSVPTDFRARAQALSPQARRAEIERLRAARASAMKGAM